VYTRNFTETRCITHSYVKLLSKLLTASDLPIRKATHVKRLGNHPNIFVDYVEDLIENSLQEVLVPLIGFAPTPP